MSDVTGHAVRMLYLLCGMADVAAETGDEGLRAASARLWDSMTRRRMYVTGGLGARWEGEAFGGDYELPNARAYAETCAAIGSVMWNQRLLQIDPQARYADLLEHTLINAVLPGLSLDGREYFYQNPLEDGGTHRRQPWFGCACCPPNVARLLASLPGYFYGVTDAGDVYVSLYAESDARIALPDGRVVTLTQRTKYPWDGDVRLTVEGVEGGDNGGEFALHLRLPGWCEPGGVFLDVNGEPAGPTPLTPGTFVELRRNWKPGDTVRLFLAMPVRRIACHPHVAENVGRVALQRGPVVYCIEGADNPNIDLRDVVLRPRREPQAQFRPDLLGGVVTLHAMAVLDAPNERWSGPLYQPGTDGPSEGPNPPLEVIAVPYFAWANRAPGQMRVWIRED
jgi:hypothetical protein